MHFLFPSFHKYPIKEVKKFVLISKLYEHVRMCRKNGQFASIKESDDTTAKNLDPSNGTPLESE